MKYNFKQYIFFIILIFIIGINNINADLKDYSGGGSGSIGNLSGKGNWIPTYSGIKIGIVDENNVLEDVEIILGTGLPNYMYFSNNNNPKMFQPSEIKWNYEKTSNYVSTNLVPDSWIDSNDKSVNLYEWLSSDGYSKLMSILSLKKENTELFPTLGSGDFIIVEPMTYIDGYFGTAYELGNAFLTLTEACYASGNFCSVYSGAVFGGINSTANPSRKCGGIFHKIIYLEENVPTLGLTVSEDTYGCSATSSIFRDRNNCLKSSTCGRGIGVFEYDNLYSGSIEITKYKTGTTTPISGAGFTLYSNSSCTVKLKNEEFTNAEGKVIFSNLKTGTYYYKETTIPDGYTGNLNCNSINVVNKSKSTTTAYNTENPKTGDLNINIKIKGTNTLITSSSATFEIYSGSNCTGTLIDTVSTSMGSLTTELNAGTYSIKEKTHPSGYAKSNPLCVKRSTTITAGNRTTEDIFYEPTCNTKLTNLGSNPTKEQLFNLYKEYPNNRNLLNLTNPSCTTGSCGNNSLSLNCLSGSTNTSQFNENNLSCYNGDPLIDSITGNYIGFCQTSYQLTNNLGINKFYGKSGRLLITQKENIITVFKKDPLNKIVEKNITAQFIATSTISKVCYSLNELNVNNINTLPQYNVYFGDNNNDGNADSLPNTENQTPAYHSVAINGLNRYDITKTNNYTLNALYLEKISGKYSSVQTPSTTTEPIYGVLSRFDVENGVIPFKINDKSSNNCTFATEKEIIKDKIDLEFRTIDTKEPFNRNTMSNWSDNTDKSKDNDVVTKYIKDAVNSYGLDKYGNKTNPIYKIILNPDDIKIIREYNKTNKYDDYLTEEVHYGPNVVVRNKFLYSLEKGKLNDKNLSNKLYNSKYPI